MPTPYYQSLIQLVQPGGELEQLQHDVENASTALAQRETNQRMFNLNANLIYHCISLTEELIRLRVLQRGQQAAPTPTPVIAPAPAAPAYYTFPAPPSIAMLRPSAPSASAGLPGTSEISPTDVPQVVITPSGTKVIPPAGSGAAAVVVPPNTPVRLDQVGGPPAPAAPPPGIVVPQGGIVTPELAAALASRQGG